MATQLFLMRHGDALAGHPDAQRALSELGRQQVASVIGQCAPQIPVLDDIFVSPLLRAKQTLSIAMEQLKTSGQPQSAPWAVPESSEVSAVDGLALRVAPGSSALLVTHNPFVTYLIYELTGQMLSMPTATLVALSVTQWQRNGAQVLWSQSPKT